MKRVVLALLPGALAGLLPGQVAADPYVGHFVAEQDGRHYRVTIERINATSYDGILRIDDEPMQLDARRYGDSMSGRLQSNRGKFGFRARVQGGVLVMDTEDGRRVVLTRSAPQ